LGNTLKKEGRKGRSNNKTTVRRNMVPGGQNELRKIKDLTERLVGEKKSEKLQPTKASPRKLFKRKAGSSCAKSLEKSATVARARTECMEKAAYA